MVRKHAVVQQPIARCITGYFCSVCKPYYSMALAMGLHPRLGKESPVAMLTEDLLHTIIEMTKPKRQLPEWMCCRWNIRTVQRRQPSAVLFSSRPAKRELELADTTAPQESNTTPEKECTPTALRIHTAQKK